MKKDVLVDCSEDGVPFAGAKVPTVTVEFFAGNVRRALEKIQFHKIFC